MHDYFKHQSILWIYVWTKQFLLNNDLYLLQENIDKQLNHAFLNRNSKGIYLLQTDK